MGMRAAAWAKGRGSVARIRRGRRIGIMIRERRFRVREAVARRSWGKLRRRHLPLVGPRLMMLRRLVGKLWLLPKGLLLGVLVSGSTPREGRWMLLPSGDTVWMAGIRLGVWWPIGMLLWRSWLGRPLWRRVASVPTWSMVLRHGCPWSGMRSRAGGPGLYMLIWSMGWIRRGPGVVNCLWVSLRHVVAGRRSAATRHWAGRGIFEGAVKLVCCLLAPFTDSVPGFFAEHGVGKVLELLSARKVSRVEFAPRPSVQLRWGGKVVVRLMWRWVRIW